ncbi:type VI secretion system protein TssR domain-containing protein [Pedobacter sp. D749]|uniref:type VI secretion system protein TssR domain-containing protein n=1 Tax=Pedobacter sp. D749 TaxID=2856523 RepID=UPI001C5789EE|nr:type VI secretion system protein TssR domain-containing protein [Pedobacter sp. D749]QXU41169.1 VWA domain-containing protein [Pedobacter sp. D749]
MKKYYALTILFLGISFAYAQSPASFGKKVKYMPKSYERPAESINVNENTRSSSLPWIVFSDREDNYTTTAPGGSLIMKKISFMEPFYVSKEQNGYLKLIKYKAGMIRGRKINDKKSAISYGWIAKSKLLLWQRAFSNQKTGYAEKAIGIVNGKNALTEPKFYFDTTDSILVYNTPELKDRRTKVRLHEIAYIYKKSEDGKKYLIGSDDQLVADTALKSIYGWVSAEAIHSWGDRLYITSVKPGDYDTDDSTALAIKNGMDKGTAFVIDPLLSRENLILRSVPVVSNDEGSNMVGIAADVYNKKDNKLLTINGSSLSYQDYLKLRKNKTKVNVVFVMDGGSPMTKYFSGMTNTIASFENIMGDFGKGTKVNFGGVVYRGETGCGQQGIFVSPIQDDYRKLMTFLSNQAKNTMRCNGEISEEPVFSALKAGINLFKAKKNETNLIILVGSTGNSGGTNNYLINELSEQVALADARILALQVYSDFNQSFNDFVIQSRKLVSESAIRSAEYRKNTMVKGEGLKSFQPYNTSLQDSISYYLDYPKNSLIQGGVVFPTKGSVNSNQSMTIALRRFVKETNSDIYNQISSLDSAFRLTGISRKNLSTEVEGLLPEPVGAEVADRMPHNAFKYYTTANLSADVVKNNRSNLQYAIVLNNMEYKQIVDVFSIMLGQNLQADQSSFRRKLVKNYVRMPKQFLGMKISSSDIKAMTLSNYIKLVTGLPLNNEFLSKYMVSDLKNTSKMPLEEFETYIKLLNQSVQQIKRATQIEQQFISNGKIYYYITEDNFNPAVLPTTN